MPNQLSVITKEIESKLYEIESLLKDGYSVGEIQEKLVKYSYGGIYNCIQRNGLSDYVSVKNNGKSRKRKKLFDDYDNKHQLNFETLNHLYNVEKKDLYEIAKIFGFSPSGVLYRMKKLGIQTRNKSDASVLMYMKHPELRETHRKNANEGKTGVFMKGNNYSNTWIEIAFREYCGLHNIQFYSQYQITKDTHRYDFLIGKNILVELDGVYWHNKPKQKIKDELQEKYAVDNGFTLLRITDKQIKETKGECFEIIKRYV
jgi:very-short-patch-repair endonuclease